MYVYEISILGTRNISDKRCKENQGIHFVFNNFIIFENRVIHKILVCGKI
jgi:hypothetical protein